MKNDESFLTIDRSGSDCDHNSVTFDVDGKIVQLRIMGLEVLLSDIVISEDTTFYNVDILFSKSTYCCFRATITASSESPKIKMFTTLRVPPMIQEILVDKILIDGYKTILNKDEIKEFKELINTKIL